MYIFVYNFEPDAVKRYRVFFKTKDKRQRTKDEPLKGSFSSLLQEGLEGGF